MPQSAGRPIHEQGRRAQSRGKARSDDRKHCFPTSHGFPKPRHAPASASARRRTLAVERGSAKKLRPKVQSTKAWYVKVWKSWRMFRWV